MLSLQRLRADHGPAVLAFERENRAWFAASVSDRGDAWFERFDAHLSALLEDQEAGRAAFHVLVDDDGAVVGRFNLDPIAAGAARVGYRVAESVGGRGVATAALRELCAVATDLGLHTLVAATTETNVASRRVLFRAGFVDDGPADPVEVGGRPGRRFRRVLTG